MVHRLGVGTFGTVSKFIRHKDKQPYAIKTVDIDLQKVSRQHNRIILTESMKKEENSLKLALREIRLQQNLRHPNIILLKDAFYDPSLA
jgi:serine/threonine protein kinase